MIAIVQRKPTDMSECECSSWTLCFEPRLLHEWICINVASCMRMTVRMPKRISDTTMLDDRATN